MKDGIHVIGKPLGPLGSFIETPRIGSNGRKSDRLMRWIVINYSVR